MQSTRKLAAIMFADIAGYTAMMQADETSARNALARHRQVTEELVDKHRGEIIQYYGDGALIIFSSAKESVAAAIAIQQLLRTNPAVPLRIGLHMGEIVHDSEGIYGDGVNLAARVESMSVPGSILISDRLYQEISNDSKVSARSLGKFQLKNIKDPVEIFALEGEEIIVPQPAELNYAKGKTLSKSIAVLPFTSMASPKNPDYFADGVSEEIINGLSKVTGIDVVSGSTCRAIAQAEDPFVRAQQLKVAYFLEGSVRKAENRVRVSVHLVSTDDGYQLWAESYDRDLSNIFEVQDEIARKVVNRLKVSFDIPSQSEPVVNKATENIEAYNQHLKGLYHLKKGNPDDTKKAIEYFDKALTMDPGFASAECALSRCYSFLGSCGAIPAVSAYGQALNCVITALDKNPNLAEGHLAMANIKFYHFWDWDGAKESLDKAVALGLNSADLHQSYGLYFAAVGKAYQGIPKMLKALELDPLSIPIMNMLGTLYLFDQQYRKAVAIYDEILDLEPSFRGAHQYKGVTLACLGQYQQALQEFETYHQKVNHPKKALIGLIIAHHHLGDTNQAAEYIDRLYGRLKEDYSAAVEVDLAIAHAGIGEYDKAIEFLEGLYEKRLSIACMGMIWVVRCPFFKGLWSHPGYHKLLKKMGMAA